jgi:PPOX class probable F420-dependent enzyme
LAPAGGLNALLAAAPPEIADRLRQRLTGDVAAWFTTVGDDGTPQPNPIWFLWDGGDELLIYNRPTAARLKHVGARPRAALSFESENGRNVAVLTGSARVVDEPPPHEVPAYVEKYRERMLRVGGSLEEFSRRYRTAIRFRPDKLR